MQPEPVVEASTACIYCGEVAEPEQDGVATYFACTGCGGEFGYRHILQEEPLCAAGLPIRVKAAQPAGTSVFLGSVIGRRPE